MAPHDGETIATVSPSCSRRGTSIGRSPTCEAIELDYVPRTASLWRGARTWRLLFDDVLHGACGTLVGTGKPGAERGDHQAGASHPRGLCQDVWRHRPACAATCRSGALGLERGHAVASSRAVRRQPREGTAPAIASPQGGCPDARRPGRPPTRSDVREVLTPRRCRFRALPFVDQAEARPCSRGEVACASISHMEVCRCPTQTRK